jgi:hypothetical protein
LNKCEYCDRSEKQGHLKACPNSTPKGSNERQAWAAGYIDGYQSRAADQEWGEFPAYGLGFTCGRQDREQSTQALSSS